MSRDSSYYDLIRFYRVFHQIISAGAQQVEVPEGDGPMKFLGVAHKDPSPGRQGRLEWTVRYDNRYFRITITRCHPPKQGPEPEVYIWGGD